MGLLPILVTVQADAIIMLTPILCKPAENLNFNHIREMADFEI